MQNYQQIECVATQKQVYAFIQGIMTKSNTMPREFIRRTRPAIACNANAPRSIP